MAIILGVSGGYGETAQPDGRRTPKYYRRFH